jgi:hypothetical protein
MKLTRVLPGILALTMAGSVAGPVQAGAAGAVEPLRSLILGITEGPDPIPQVHWRSYHAVHELVTNDDRVYGNAGRPDVSGTADQRVVVWAWQIGGDRDVAISRWDGEDWTAEGLVTNSPADQIEPRAFVAAAGTIHVVWWIQGEPGESPYVVHTQGDGIDWSVERTVTEEGRRPSIVAHKNSLLVVFERSAGLGQDIIIAVQDGAGDFKTLWGWNVDRVEPLDAVLHVEGDTLWVDWKHSSSEIGYSIWINEGWTPPATVPWTDPSWSGEMSARALVHEAIFGSPVGQQAGPDVDDRSGSDLGSYAPGR